MTFPAVTFCIGEFNIRDLIFNSKNLTSKLIYCNFDALKCNEISYLKPVQFTFSGKKADCYSFNSGKNGLLSARGIGMGSGLNILFNFTEMDKLFFKVHDNNERPTFYELNDIVEQEGGKFIPVEIKKTIET
jgi:hypothetical protein